MSTENTEVIVPVDDVVNNIVKLSSDSDKDKLKEATAMIVAEGEKTTALFITDDATYSEVKKAAYRIMKIRTGLAAAAKEAKKPLQEDIKKIDATQKDLLAVITKYEDPLKAKVKAWDEEEARKEQEKADREKKRQDHQMARVEEIRGIPVKYRDLPSDKIQEALDALRNRNLAEAAEPLEEYLAQAQVAQSQAITELERYLQSALDREENARLKEQLAAMQAAQAPAEEKSEPPAATDGMPGGKATPDEMRELGMEEPPEHAGTTDEELPIDTTEGYREISGVESDPMLDRFNVQVIREAQGHVIQVTGLGGIDLLHVTPAQWPILRAKIDAAVESTKAG